MRKIPVSMVTPRQRVRVGNRTLSKDEWSAVQTLNDATDGDIPAVRSKPPPPPRHREPGAAAPESDEFITHAELVRQLRKSGKGLEQTLAAIKHPHFRGRGPLHMAAWAGRLEMCKFLVEELHLNVNAPGDDGATPLSYAIFGCGSTSVVRFLLDRGAKPNKANINGVTALHYAAMPGANADPEGDRLWAANTRDACEIAELLLSRGAYVDPICAKGTPLNVAAQKGNVRMLELLLRHQANPNTVVHLVYTPLSYAISASSLKCMELLIKAGADVNAGRPVVTPLIIAASYGFTCGIKCLLEAGADANIPDEFGRTAAQIAATNGWMDCVEILSPLTASAGTNVMVQHANFVNSKSNFHFIFCLIKNVFHFFI
ncbi:ankyrin-1-like [Lolium rigidum]|uniref:ankyrin-1-like n=1 Tax=Lolium rigidum TaxID=89674 RepID=UPI001F5C7584|nr:ankyrin-1-like [Lolium rigidum]